MCMCQLSGDSIPQTHMQCCAEPSPFRRCRQRPHCQGAICGFELIGFSYLAKPLVQPYTSLVASAMEVKLAPPGRWEGRAPGVRTLCSSGQGGLRQQMQRPGPRTAAARWRPLAPPCPSIHGVSMQATDLCTPLPLVALLPHGMVHGRGCRCSRSCDHATMPSDTACQYEFSAGSAALWGPPALLSRRAGGGGRQVLPVGGAAAQRQQAAGRPTCSEFPPLLPASC